MIFFSFIAFGLVLVAFIVFAVVLSFRERERNAAVKLLFTGLGILLLHAIPILFPFDGADWFMTVVLCVYIFLALLLLLPIKYKNEISQQPVSRFDERDTMFSRNELKPETELYEQYYTNRPSKKMEDDKWRKLPGLLSDKSLFFDKKYFAIADANFHTISSLYQFIEGDKATDKTDIDSREMTHFIKQWIDKLGVHSSGVALLNEYHYYSHKGRKAKYGKKIEQKHKYAIAFTLEMDFEMTASAPTGAIVAESSQQYLRAGNVAVQLAAFIRGLGYDAKAHIDGNYDVICPLIARDAGLGEIGRMGLLMTPKFGPRVRIGVVTTDMPLVANIYKPDYSIINFCNICKKCADTCPSKAISKTERKGAEGAKRWTINHEACFTYWCKAGTDCGRCMAVCPYSHPDNLLHNIVRTGIRNFPMFGRIAYLLDDILYGRKPKPKPLPF